jgi:hypothetical protein
MPPLHPITESPVVTPNEGPVEVRSGSSSRSDDRQSVAAEAFNVNGAYKRALDDEQVSGKDVEFGIASELISTVIGPASFSCYSRPDATDGSLNRLVRLSPLHLISH